ncbi:hypothetical protein LX32DRAFT_419234 [Colletotrichum zoysiae]|uniref:Uncharacterized protein n=1 Tax=Colletotrichum zoysiae TaxID=1216348 RepID=A0AAD9HSP4_9PEZI|nr:hypothetical protein LX32DRAFT_419234 [Colletotrichum zoysiae]
MVVNSSKRPMIWLTLIGISSSCHKMPTCVVNVAIYERQARMMVSMSQELTCKSAVARTREWRDLDTAWSRSILST